LLHISEQDKVISVELRNKEVLSVGLISFDCSLFVDYPIYIDAKSELTLLFIKFILKLLNYNLDEIVKEKPDPGIDFDITIYE